MKYLKVWVSFREALTPYSDAERGRLFTAMLAYADSGEEPHFSGNERFIWPQVKQTIDLTAEKNEKLRENGRRGGRPPKTNENQTEPNETNENQTKANESLKEKKRKEKELITDDDDDLSRARQKDQVYNHFLAYFGWPPTKEQVNQIATSASLLGFTTDMACEALRVAAKYGARNPVAYVQELLQDWQAMDIRTPEEYGRVQYLRDMGDKDGLDAYQKERKAAHGGERA